MVVGLFFYRNKPKSILHSTLLTPVRDCESQLAQCKTFIGGYIDYQL
jgi:hypothetical protein